jgi:hypothetical protein
VEYLVGFVLGLGGLLLLLLLDLGRSGELGLVLLLALDAVLVIALGVGLHGVAGEVVRHGIVAEIVRHLAKAQEVPGDNTHDTKRVSVPFC